MTRRRMVTLALLGVAVLAVTAWRLTRHPRADRDWLPDQRLAPTVTFAGDTVRIVDVRDADPRTRAPRWHAMTVDLARLDSVWLVVAPFSTKWRGPAHTFVSFGFSDGTYLAVSVEARREVGEEYGVVAGALDRFEVLYVVGTEHDLIGRRVFDDEGPVYLYPIRAERAALRTLLTEMLTRADRLRTHPEFYNTFTNNCTSNLVAHVNRVVTRKVPGGLVTLLPGYADAVADRLGLLAADGTLDEMRRRFEIGARARAALDAPDFSRRIREAAP
ncbi:MAG TPA: DUF4105 domain-containing protein [Gemmatimonadales bacterium]|nr:DUF4105 domain-containing protein [Gemmatimonadales bacterium]